MIRSSWLLSIESFKGQVIWGLRDQERISRGVQLACAPSYFCSDRGHALLFAETWHLTVCEGFGTATFHLKVFVLLAPPPLKISGSPLGMGLGFWLGGTCDIVKGQKASIDYPFWCIVGPKRGQNCSNLHLFLSHSASEKDNQWMDQQ